MAKAASDTMSHLLQRMTRINFGAYLRSKHMTEKPTINKMLLGIEVLTEASMKVSIFWVVASLVEVYRRFRGACCLQGPLMMEAASTSETSVNFYQTTRRCNPEDTHLQNILLV
jgi:hypothetical protein